MPIQNIIVRPLPDDPEHADIDVKDEQGRVFSLPVDVIMRTAQSHHRALAECGQARISKDTSSDPPPKGTLEVEKIMRVADDEHMVAYASNRAIALTMTMGEFVAVAEAAGFLVGF